MRILHVVPTYYPAVRYGGPIHSVHGLARALVCQGHDVHVFTTNADGPGVSNVPLERPVDIDGVSVSYFPTGFGRRIYRSPRMNAALKAQTAEFDVLHLHSVFLWPTAAAARHARQAGVPYVLAPRGMLVQHLVRQKSSMVKNAWIAAIERVNIASAAAIHVTSNIEAADFAPFNFSYRRIVVIPNGVDMPSGWQAAGHQDFSARSVLFLGRLSWKKGIDRLIEAMHLVPDAKLIIAGNDDENYRPKIERMIKNFGITRRVCLLGALERPQIWKLLASVCVLVLPSYSENFGNVVLEAMAVGCPVIVTKEVGLADLIRETGAGLVVDGAPATLSGAINRMLNDVELQKKAGAAGLDAVTRRFRWESIAEQTTSLYGEIIKAYK